MQSSAEPAPDRCFLLVLLQQANNGDAERVSLLEAPIFTKDISEATSPAAQGSFVSTCYSLQRSPLQRVVMLKCLCFPVAAHFKDEHHTAVSALLQQLLPGD